MRAKRALGVGLAWALWSMRAEADSFSAEVHRSHASCPGLSEFVAQVQEASERARYDGEGPAGFHFDVRLEQNEGGGFVGRLETRAADGQVSKREVAADSCSEALTALAWIAVLHVDPEAHWDEDEKDPSAPVVAGPAASFEPMEADHAATPAPPAEPAATHSVSTDSAIQSSSNAETPSVSPAVSSPQPLSVHPLFGVEGGYQVGIAPGGSANVAALLGLELDDRFQLRLVATWTPTVSSQVAQERARLSALGGRLELGMNLYRAPALGLAGYWMTEVMAIHAEGQEAGRLTQPSDDWVTGVATGPELRLHVGSEWRLEAYAAVPVGVHQHRIWMDLPDGPTLYFEAPVLGVRTGLSLVVLVGPIDSD